MRPSEHRSVARPRLLLGLLPLLGGLVLLIFFIIGGTRGPNRFGLDPVEVGEGTT